MSYTPEELIARASDPNAELTTLHQLAQNHPEVRAYIAANPRTYPALLEWLGKLGDPAVDAALAARNQGTAPMPATPATPPVRTSILADAAATTVQAVDAVEEADAAQAADAVEQGAQSDSDSEPATQALGSPTAGMPQEPDQVAQQAAETQATSVLPQASQSADLPATQVAQATQVSPALQGGLGTQTTQAAQPGTSATALFPVSQAAASNPHNQPLSWPPRDNTVFGVGQEDPEPEHRGTWLWILAGIALVLVIAVASWFLMSNLGKNKPSVAIATGTPSTATQTVQPTQQPTADATSAQPTPEATPTPSPTPTAAAYPAPEGAVNSSSFSAPSGNIACTLEGGTTNCTIQNYNFTPQGNGCTPTADGNQALTVSIDAEGNATTNCTTAWPNTVGPLLYGTATSYDGYACTSAETGITCWSEKTGRGFSIARQGVHTIQK